MEWTREKYNSYYDSYMPWVEDKYLQWFGENKTSYTAKEQLKSTKITGDKNVDALQDGIAESVGGQFGKGGLGEGVGNLVSKEGFTRAEETDKPNVKESGGVLGGALGGGK
ncbi:MAG: hypothetical protein M1830_009463 [Pleopsidium flavum]|nr:MAG: hypothetical protein M1830_009463 [Pleopsidium flavum]